MKCEVIPTTPPKPVLPEIGQPWRHADNDNYVYWRINDLAGQRALNRPIGEGDAYFYSVSLLTGHVSHTTRNTSDIQLLRLIGGEPLKLEVVS